MAKTTIEIESNDQNQYTMKIVEQDAQNGTRIDQVIAQRILQMDQNLRNPQTQQMLQMFKQNPMAAMQRMMRGGMGRGGMMPGAGGNMMW
jgi:hypothetical protein